MHSSLIAQNEASVSTRSKSSGNLNKAAANAASSLASISEEADRAQLAKRTKSPSSIRLCTPSQTDDKTCSNDMQQIYEAVKHLDTQINASQKVNELI